MCLTLIETYKTKKTAIAGAVPLIAKKRMIVYKSLSRHGKKFVAPYYYMEYKEGEHYYQEGNKFGLRFYKANNQWRVSIEHGLHSCLTRDKAGRMSGDIVVEMIIPKGSEYFINSNGCIVSDNLIFPWKN